MRYALVLAVLLTSLGTAAQAEILAGGPLYGGTTQTDAVCYIFNAGAAAVSLGKPQIRTQNGSLKSLSSNNCSATLAARRGCAWAANIASNLAHECQMDVSSKTDVRGSLEIRNSSLDILNSVELR
jgi:hypothetical protein